MYTDLLESLVDVPDDEPMFTQVCPQCGPVGQQGAVLPRLTAVTQGLVVQDQGGHGVTAAVLLVPLLLQGLGQHVVLPSGGLGPVQLGFVPSLLEPGEELYSLMILLFGVLVILPQLRILLQTYLVEDFLEEALLVSHSPDCEATGHM